MNLKKLLLAGITSIALFLGVSATTEASEINKEEKVKLAVKHGCDYGKESYCGYNDTEEEQYTVNEECEYLNPNYCGNNALTNGLESNQTTLFYMYSNKEGHFLLDPLADFENIIFVSFEDVPKLEGKLHHGKRFIGTFTDNELWELESLKEVFYK